MPTPPTVERLARLLPHLAEHTAEHAEEIAQWQRSLGDALDPQITEMLNDAARHMQEAREMLLQAAREIEDTVAN